MNIGQLAAKVRDLATPPSFAPVEAAVSRAVTKTNQQLSAMQVAGRVRQMRSGNRIRVLAPRTGSRGMLESPSSLFQRNLAPELDRAKQEMVNTMRARQ